MCCRALEDLQRRVNQGVGAVSNSGAKEAERQATEQRAAERVSTAEARATQAEAAAAAARADVDTLKGIAASSYHCNSE